MKNTSTSSIKLDKINKIVESNLDDDLKLELINALMDNHTTVPVYPIYTEDQWLRGNDYYNPYKVTCGDHTGRRVDVWNPSRDAYEKAQADCVTNGTTFYSTVSR